MRLIFQRVLKEKKMMTTQKSLDCYIKNERRLLLHSNYLVNSVYMNIFETFRGVTVIVVGNGNSDTSSNPGQD